MMEAAEGKGGRSLCVLSRYLETVLMLANS